MQKINVFIFNICLISNCYAETLEEAWAVGLNVNHQIKAAQANTQVSQAQLETAQGQNLPELNIGSNYTQYNETPSAQTTIDGNAAQFPTQQAGSVKAQAIASIPLYTSGRITHDINAAQAVLQATQASENVTGLNLKMQIAENYVTVLRTQDAVDVAMSHIHSLENHAKDVKNLFDQGMVAKNDVLAADVELANAKQLLMQASHFYDNSKARYNQFLARPLNATVQLTKQFPADLNASLDNLNQIALSQRPELAVLNEQMNALEQQIQSVEATLKPQISLNGGYQYQQNRYQVYEGLWTANVGVDWKLFDGTNHPKANAFEKQILVLKEQHDELTGQILLQVRESYLATQEAKQRLQVAQQAIIQADENMKVTTDRYQQGLTTHTEVSKAQELQLLARNNLNNSQYDLMLANLRLKRATTW